MILSIHDSDAVQMHLGDFGLSSQTAEQLLLPVTNSEYPSDPFIRGVAFSRASSEFWEKDGGRESRCCPGIFWESRAVEPNEEEVRERDWKKLWASFRALGGKIYL